MPFVQIGIVTVLFVVFLVVWMKTENKGWRALTGTVLALSVVWLMVSTFQAAAGR